MKPPERIVVALLLVCAALRGVAGQGVFGKGERASR